MAESDSVTNGEVMSFIRKFSMRVRQYNWQEGLCCWCLKPMNFTLPIHARDDDPYAATWEHIVPRTAGGSSGRNNTVMAHRCCNMARGHSQVRIPLFKPYPNEKANEEAETKDDPRGIQPAVEAEREPEHVGSGLRVRDERLEDFSGWYAVAKT